MEGFGKELATSKSLWGVIRGALGARRASANLFGIIEVEAGNEPAAEKLFDHVFQQTKKYFPYLLPILPESSRIGEVFDEEDKKKLGSV